MWTFAWCGKEFLIISFLFVFLFVSMEKVEGENAKSQRQHRDDWHRRAKRNKILQNSFIFILQLRLLLSLPLSSVVIQIIFNVSLSNHCSRAERREKDGHKNAYKKRRKHFQWILKAIVCLMRSCRRFSHLNNNFLNYFPPLCRPLGFGCCLRWDLWTVLSLVLLCSFALGTLYFVYTFSFVVAALLSLYLPTKCCTVSSPPDDMQCNEAFALPFVFHSTMLTLFFPLCAMSLHLICMQEPFFMRNSLSLLPNLTFNCEF